MARTPNGSHDPLARTCTRARSFLFVCKYEAKCLHEWCPIQNVSITFHNSLRELSTQGSSTKMSIAPIITALELLRQSNRRRRQVINMSQRRIRPFGDPLCAGADRELDVRDVEHQDTEDTGSGNINTEPVSQDSTVIISDDDLDLSCIEELPESDSFIGGARYLSEEKKQPDYSFPIDLDVAEKEANADYLGIKPWSEEKTFRIAAKNFAITYPNSGDLSIEMVRDFFKLKYNAIYVIVAKEFHKSGKPHIHAMVEFSKKKNFKDCNCFDITIDSGIYHPNIQGCRNVSDWSTYIKKGGDFIEDIKPYNPSDYDLGRKKKMHDDFIFEANFYRRKKREAIKWPVDIKVQQYCYSGNQEEGRITTWIMNAPDVTDKKRNYWIVSPPNAGKTYFINKTFKNKRVYLPTKGDYPFEMYDDEELVIYDDIVPSFAEIADVCNTWDVDKHVFGKSRYVAKLWPLGLARNVIVMSNKRMHQVYKNTLPAMEARFHEIEIERFIIE